MMKPVAFLAVVLVVLAAAVRGDDVLDSATTPEEPPTPFQLFAKENPEGAAHLAQIRLNNGIEQKDINDSDIEVYKAHEPLLLNIKPVKIELKCSEHENLLERVKCYVSHSYSVIAGGFAAYSAASAIHDLVHEIPKHVTKMQAHAATVIAPLPVPVEAAKAAVGEVASPSLFVGKSAQELTQLAGVVAASGLAGIAIKETWQMYKKPSVPKAVAMPEAVPVKVVATTELDGTSKSMTIMLIVLIVVGLGIIMFFTVGPSNQQKKLAFSASKPAAVDAPKCTEASCPV